jgi:uncharacterized integral membrane protein
MRIKLIMSLVLAFLAFVFIVQNTDPVQVTFLFWSVEMSRVVLLLIMFGAGMIIGWVLSGYLRYVRGRQSGASGDKIARQSADPLGKP